MKDATKPRLLWTDATSYAKGDTERVPTSWAARVGPFRVFVHRHVYYPPTTWLLTCFGLFEHRMLTSTDARNAKLEAETIIEKTMREVLRAFEES